MTYINSLLILVLVIGFFVLKSKDEFNHKRLIYLECVAILGSDHEMCKKREPWKS